MPILELISPLNVILLTISDPKTIAKDFMTTGPLKLSFPIYYLPIRSNFHGKNTYIMDIDIPLYREKDKDGIEKPDADIISFWIKKGSCILLNKGD